jgi:hypothetical protein
MPQTSDRYLSVLLRRFFSVFHYFDFRLLSRKIGDWLPVAPRLAASAFSSFGSFTQQIWFTGFS